MTRPGSILSRPIPISAAARISTLGAMLDLMLASASPVGAAPVNDLRARARDGVGIWVGNGFIHATHTGDVIRFVAGSAAIRDAVRPG